MAKVTTRPKRRAKGDGSIYYVKSRRMWQGSVTMPDGRRRTLSHPNREACAAKLRELQARLGGGQEAIETTTLADYLRWWLQAQEAKAGPTGRDAAHGSVA